MVDEFHHADAKTYRNLLNHFEPTFLLGLTATPERTDQADIISLCDNNLVFERNLVHGINAQLLAPFQYNGINDRYVDYDEIPWRNGKFDPYALENAFASRKRAEHVLHHWKEKRQLRTLGFCISKRHADYMAEVFTEAGVRAAAVYSNSELRRNEALRLLAAGDLDILFSVDLFNEGTDLPAIDTVLMIRPTESKILFLQQLGRGLRRHKEKKHLVVIDFIGNHESFLTKLITLHGAHSYRQVSDQIKTGKMILPNGCFANYDPEVIDFLDRMVRSQKATMVDEYQSLKSMLGYRPTATEFYHYISETGTDFNKVRSQNSSWLGLLAQVKDLTPSESEVNRIHGQFLLNGIEKAAMSKCFKMILLDAFLELDGFLNPPSTEKLAEKSWHLLKRRPVLYQSELPAKQQSMSADEKGWHSYWKGNPIKAFSEGKDTLFEVREGNFTFKEAVRSEHKDQLYQFVQELVELRLEQYCVRKGLRPDISLAE